MNDINETRKTKSTLQKRGNQHDKKDEINATEKIEKNKKIIEFRSINIGIDKEK